MLRIIILAVILGAVAFGRFYSEWMYPLMGVDINDDPDRLLGTAGALVIGGAVVLVLSCLAWVAVPKGTTPQDQKR